MSQFRFTIMAKVLERHLAKSTARLRWRHVYCKNYWQATVTKFLTVASLLAPNRDNDLSKHFCLGPFLKRRLSFCDRKHLQLTVSTHSFLGPGRTAPYGYFSIYSADNYMFKVSNRNTRARLTLNMFYTLFYCFNC